MKKTILLAIITLFFTTGIVAQEKMSFGVKGGVNFSTFGGRDFFFDEETKNRIGLHIGVLLEIPISDTFSIQPELLYSQQGSRSIFDLVVSTGPNAPINTLLVENTIKNDYINIPLLANYNIIQGLSIQAGPQFGFNVNSKLVTEIEGDSSETLAIQEDFMDGFTEDLSDTTSTFDLGFALGGMYEFPTGIFFQARYVFGISNVDDFEDQQETFSDDTLKNRIFQLSAGYKF